MFTDPAISPAGESRRINVFGGIDLRIPTAETGGIISIWESHAGPGEGPPLHVHANEDEVFYVLEGTFEFRCGDRTFVGGHGTTAVLPRGVPHTYRNVGVTAGRFLGAAMPGGFEEFFIEIERGRFVTPEGIQAVGERFGLTFVEPMAAPAEKAA